MIGAFTIFWIIVVVVLSLDFISAIVLCLLENKLKKEHPDNADEAVLEKVTKHAVGEDIYLHIADGVVSVINELPKVAVAVPTAAAAEEVTEVLAEELPAEEEVVAEDNEAAAVAYDDEVAEVEDEEGDDQRKVVIIASEQKLTYLDKLAALDKEIYALYEELVNYLVGKEYVKQNTTSNKSIFKYKTDRLVISTVRRGVITLQFMLINSSLERYMRAEGAKQIKVTPVTIRLVDEASLERAKSTADLTIEHLEQERVYNAEQKKAARREARRLKAEQERAAQAEAAATTTDAGAADGE